LIFHVTTPPPQGSQFDAKGDLVDWWAPATKRRYAEKVKCIVNQYSKYSEYGIQVCGPSSPWLNDNIDLIDTVLDVVVLIIFFNAK
jgi:predicted metalloendopeptidase